MEIRERDNNLLYGVSPWRLLSGYLPQNKDVDLCVESYIYKGYSEKEAANFTACDLIRKYSVLTSSNITKKSHLVARILKLRERRRKKLKELSIDNRTGEERKTGRGKNCTPKPHVAPFDFSAQSSELFTCLTTVAEVDEEFLQDQKGPRTIRRSEQVVTNPIMESSPPRASTNTSPPEEQHSGFEQESDVEDENQTNDPDYVQPSSRTRKGKKINPDLLQLSERFGFSAEATAHIHNIYSEQKYTTEGVRLSKNGLE